MTRLLHWSDLHTEFGAFDLPEIPDDIDGLLLAGDTAVGRGHLDFLMKAWEAYRIPIVSIHGNHEYYNNSFESLLRHEKEQLPKLRAKGADIRVLHGETTRIGEAVIFGATLWTDYQLYPGQDFAAKQIAKSHMNDFRTIHIRFQGGLITPEDLLVLHNDDRARMIEAMSEHTDDTLIVMTHHMPTPACVGPRYRRDLLTASFCSDLEPEISAFGPDFWIYGHTHDGLEVDIPTPHGTTRIRHNPRGYPNEGAPFNPFRIIDTQRPDLKSL